MARRFFKNFKAFVLFALVIGGAWAFQRWAYEAEIIEIDGKKASVIDGDSFKIGDNEFRIYGIDAPEYRQLCADKNGRDWACGKAARNGLDTRLRRGKFSCDVQAKDQFGRTIVICSDQEGKDLGSSLVELGLAASGRHFDETIYATDEAAAEKAKRGIWKGSFVRPDIWRAENPRS